MLWLPSPNPVRSRRLKVARMSPLRICGSDIARMSALRSLVDCPRVGPGNNAAADVILSELSSKVDKTR